MSDLEVMSERRNPTPVTETQAVSQTPLWNRIEEFWNEIQVGRQGSYSVERLELLEHYCKTTSKTRVFLVCVLTPIPVLTVAVLLECLPLRPPSEGWAANWMFWVRLSFMVFTLSLAGFSQINAFIPGFNLTVTKMVTASLGICVAQVGTYLLEGAVFGFPVPFMWQLGAITMALYAPAVTRLVFGPDLFEKALTGVYPLYKVLYDLIPHGYRGAVIIVLPIWKFLAKRFVVHATRELEDFIPELVAFSVDFFSALFLSVCMTTSGSIYLSVLFIATDVCQCLQEFREVRNNARTLLQILDVRRATEKHLRMKYGQPTEKSDTAGLLTLILGVARNPSVYQVTSLDGARLWASPPNLIPDQLDKRMQTLGGSGIYGPRGHPSNRTASIPSERKISHCLTCWDFQHVSVAPAPVNLGSVSPPMTAVLANGTSMKLVKARSLNQTKRSKELVLQGLQLLFHCEYLALVEYIECVVPLVFVSYKSVLEQLPNVVYYPGTGSWSITAVVNLLVFAVLEVLSLILLHFFLKHKFAFSPLYQLSFVLETQFYPVQANLFLEAIFLLQYQLEHLGADFTFRFAWLRDKSE